MAPNGAMPYTRAQTAKSATQPTHLTPPAVKHISGPSESYWMVRRSILDPIFILDHDFEVPGTSGARPDPILKLRPNVTFFMRQGSCRIVRKMEHECVYPGRVRYTFLSSESVKTFPQMYRDGVYAILRPLVARYHPN